MVARADKGKQSSVFASGPTGGGCRIALRKSGNTRVGRLWQPVVPQLLAKAGERLKMKVIKCGGLKMARDPRRVWPSLASWWADQCASLTGGSNEIALRKFDSTAAGVNSEELTMVASRQGNTGMSARAVCPSVPLPKVRADARQPIPIRLFSVRRAFSQ
jgi:hypothetical protein